MKSELKTAGWLGVLLVLLSGIFLILSFGEDEKIEQSLELKKFSSESELKSFLEENTNDYGGVYRAFGGGALEAAQPATAGSAGLASSDAKSAGSFSLTNVQVEGVDELDVVKNDGTYIYAVVQDKVVITEAFPPENMRVLSELKFNGTYPTGIFVNGDKLVVVTQKYNYYLAEKATGSSDGRAVEQGFIAPYYRDTSETKMDVYDISDRENPVLEETFSSDGNYHSARMIGDFVYLISTKSAYSDDLILPAFGIGNEKAEVSASEIYYPSIVQPNFMFTSILAVDLSSLEYDGDVYLTGYSGTIYASKNNIYLTNNKFASWEDRQEEYYKSVFLESLSADVRDEIQDIIDSDLEYFEKENKIQEIYAKYFNSLTSDEKKELTEEIENLTEDFDKKWSKENEKTIIHKIEIDGLDIGYDGSGEVPGHVLNQFSIDENDGNLRIATTTGNTWGWGGADSSLNHLYVLDDDLEIIGSVEDLAKGERIYSARFIGDKAYMVTFRQVDPLFVIDLSNPRSPKVLGYLKITGFSNYLQPLDDKHLIGIGRDATEEGRTQGLKISLFDISDFENPREVDKYSVEGDWSYSEAEYEHKAVLLDKEKNLLVIPLSQSSYGNGQDYYNWQGALVLYVDEDKIDLRGKISHSENTGKNSDFYWGAYVKRSLFMDDFLYTISDRKIKVNDLGTLDEIKSLVISEVDDYYRGYSVGSDGGTEVVVAVS